jgi:hypothetical protein
LALRHPVLPGQSAKASIKTQDKAKGKVQKAKGKIAGGARSFRGLPF